MFVKLSKPFQGQPPGAQIDLSPDDAKTLVAAGVAEAVQGNPFEALLQGATDGILASIQAGLETQITKALQQFASAQTKSRKNGVPEIFGAGNSGDSKKTFGAYLLAVRHGDVKALEAMGSCYIDWENAGQKADMTSNIGARGGFAVPIQHYEDIALRVLDMSVVRPYARVIPMTGRMVEIPTPNYTTAPSSGDTATLSGLTLRWTEEGAAVTQTEPTLKQLEITNYELSGYSKLSNSLLSDSPALESFLMDLFAEGVAWYEDYAFLRGDGVKKPLGMVTWVSNNSFTQARSAASAIALADCAKLCGKLLMGTTPASKIFWAIHPTVIEKLLTMTGGDNMVFIGNDAGGKPMWKLFGYDVRVTEKLPALNTAGDLLHANGKHYVIGDRRQYEVAFSEHAGFTTNQTYFRVVSRVGGQPWLRDKVTLSDASSTLGSFVTLAPG